MQLNIFLDALMDGTCSLTLHASMKRMYGCCGDAWQERRSMHYEVVLEACVSAGLKERRMTITSTLTHGYELDFETVSLQDMQRRTSIRVGAREQREQESKEGRQRVYRGRAAENGGFRRTIEVRERERERCACAVGI
jgi:hypothetical protein